MPAIDPKSQHIAAAVVKMSQWEVSRERHLPAADERLPRRASRQQGRPEVGHAAVEASPHRLDGPASSDDIKAVFEETHRSVATQCGSQAWMSGAHGTDPTAVFVTEGLLRSSYAEKDTTLQAEIERRRTEMEAQMHMEREAHEAALSRGRTELIAAQAELAAAVREQQRERDAFNAQRRRMQDEKRAVMDASRAFEVKLDDVTHQLAQSRRQQQAQERSIAKLEEQIAAQVAKDIKGRLLETRHLGATITADGVTESHSRRAKDAGAKPPQPRPRSGAVNIEASGSAHAERLAELQRRREELQQASLAIGMSSDASGFTAMGSFSAPAGPGSGPLVPPPLQTDDLLQSVADDAAGSGSASAATSAPSSPGRPRSKSKLRNASLGIVAAKRLSSASKPSASSPRPTATPRKTVRPSISAGSSRGALPSPRTASSPSPASSPRRQSSATPRAGIGARRRSSFRSPSAAMSESQRDDDTMSAASGDFTRRSSGVNFGGSFGGGGLDAPDHHAQIAATAAAVSQLPPDELVTMLAKQQLAAQKRLVEMADRLQATVAEFERRSGPQQLSTVEGQVNAAMAEVRSLYESQLEQVRATAERRETQLNTRWAEAVRYAEIQLSEKARLAGELHDRVASAEKRAATAEQSSAGVRSECEALVVRVKQLHKAILDGKEHGSLCALCRDRVIRDEVDLQHTFLTAGRGGTGVAAQRPASAGRWIASSATGLLEFEPGDSRSARKPTGRNKLSAPPMAPGRDHLMYDAQRAARGGEPYPDQLAVASAASWVAPKTRKDSADAEVAPAVTGARAGLQPRPPSAKVRVSAPAPAPGLGAPASAQHSV